MFTIVHKQSLKPELNYLEISNGNKTTAKILLSQGASLQELTLNNNPIIKDLYPLKYSNTYASALLFPFAGRIKGGKYSFQKEDYQLEKNQINKNMAIHGLIYNKEFTVLHQQSTKDFASVKLGYNEVNKTKGFPYKYSIHVTYTLTENKIDVIVEIVNTDVKPFPFSIGWHPYFYSSDLNKSNLSFKSDKKISFNKDMIPEKVNDISFKNTLQIKDTQFDDCYILNDNIIIFKTPDYNLKMSSSSDENYLQIYTPSNKKVIAIEPLTGPSNNFNNKLGLQILKSEEAYSIQWTINLIGS